MNDTAQTNPTKRDLSDPHAVVSFRHFSRGGQARKHGQSYGSNPYPADSWEAFSWNCGWIDEK